MVARIIVVVEFKEPFMLGNLLNRPKPRKAEHRVPSAECRVPSAERRAPSAECRVPSLITRPIPSSGELVPVVGLGSAATLSEAARAQDVRDVLKTMFDLGGTVFVKPANMRDNMGGAIGRLPDDATRKRMVEYFESIAPGR